MGAGQARPWGLCCNTREERTNKLTISCETSCGFVRDSLRKDEPWFCIVRQDFKSLNFVSLTALVKNNLAKFHLLLNSKNASDKDSPINFDNCIQLCNPR